MLDKFANLGNDSFKWACGASLLMICVKLLIDQAREKRERERERE